MSAFSQDLARYRARGYSGIDIWLNPAIWSIAVYRFSNYAFTGHPPALLRAPYKLLALVLFKLCVILMEMDLDPQATIGPGFYIGHIGGVHINPGAIIGRNLDCAHRVTIGASAMGRGGIPVLGDDVYIGTGATLVGKIKIGDGAKIAANTLVITNVPAGSTVMGVPGRIIMRPKPTPTPTPPAVLPTEPTTTNPVISTEAVPQEQRSGETPVFPPPTPTPNPSAPATTPTHPDLTNA